MKILSTYEHTFISFDEMLFDNNEHTRQAVTTKIQNEYSQLIETNIDGLFIKAFVGVIKFNNVVIEVLPKIFETETEDLSNSEKIHLYRNLYHMINKSLGLPSKNIELFTFKISKGVFYDFMINIFLQNLLSKLTRNLYQSYVKEEENSRYLKGKILISKNISINPLNINIYNEYDEYTENNIVNQIFKFVVNDIFKNSYLNENKMISRNILARLSSIDDIYVNQNTFDLLPRNRLLTDFDGLLKFCKLYILGHSIDSEGSSEDEVFIFYMDMKNIYQNYISQLILEYAHVFGDQNVITQKGNRYLLYNDKNEGVFNLIPDIIFEENNLVKIIIDTKYKKLNENKKRYNVKDSDIYQMFGYYHKYDRPKIVLLYPRFHSDIKARFKFYPNNEEDLYILTVNLKEDIYLKEVEKKIIINLRDLLYDN